MSNNLDELSKLTPEAEATIKKFIGVDYTPVVNVGKKNINQEVGITNLSGGQSQFRYKVITNDNEIEPKIELNITDRGIPESGSASFITLRYLKSSGNGVTLNLTKEANKDYFYLKFFRNVNTGTDFTYTFPLLSTDEYDKVKIAINQSGTNGQLKVGNTVLTEAQLEQLLALI